MSEFVDTSLFIRVLTGGDPGKAARSLALLQRARRGEVDLYTSETVIAEVVYVLSSLATYRVPRTDVATALRPILENPGLTIEHKGSVVRALLRWRDSRLDFEDCLSVEHVTRQGLAGIYSYDRDFDRIPGVRRLEP
jgi:predicted nucleic acid-binding protein